MPRSTTRRAPVWACLAYSLLTIALTYPLILRMSDGVPSDLGDPLLVSWILWWNAHAVPFTDGFWNAPAFFPAKGTLAFSEHFMGPSLLSTPIYWLTGNIQLGYNVIFLFTFIFSALFAYLLCRALTGREDAAFVGGLIFGFTPYRIDQLPHLQMLVSLWMPLGLLGLHRYLQTKRARWLTVFGLGWVMQGLSSGHLMLFFAVLVACWLCWFVRWREWRTWLTIGVVWGLASVALLPALLGYRRIHDIYGFRRNLAEIVFYSADITGLLQAPAGVLAWRWLDIFPRAEGAIFPGITAALLIVLSVVVVRVRGASLSTARQRLHRWLGGAALFFGVTTLSAWLAPWKFSVFGLLLSNTHIENPLRLGLLTFGGWIVSSPRLIGAFRRRSAFGFYLVAAALMWMLGLGPAPVYFGEQTPLTGPYALLLNLPGFDALRAPARFAMLTALCLACAGAFALARMSMVLSRRTYMAAVAAASVLALADGWTTMAVESRPGPWPIQASLSKEPVIELPFGDASADIQALYRSTYSGSPIVNGYSGNFPPWYVPLTMALRRHDPQALEDLSALGVRHVVVDKGVEDNRDWLTHFESRPDIVLAGDDGQHRLYLLPAAARPLDLRPFGDPLHIASVDVTVNPRLIPELTDGDLRTRWHSGTAQQGTEVITIDLGATQTVGAVVMSLGEFARDAPRDLKIEMSDDRQQWATVWRGGGETPVRAALRDPRQVPFTLDVGDRTARYIRLSQLGADPVWYWSIAELTVHAAR